MRSDDIKLGENIRNSKSEQGPDGLTPLQTVKLEKYKLVQSVYKPPQKQRHLGKNACARDSYENYLSNKFS